MGRWRGVAVVWVLMVSGLVASPLAAQRIRLPENLRTLEQRARADSNDPAAHYNVALAYWNERRWDDAEGALRVAVTIDPQFASAWLALSYLPYARRNQLFEEEAEGRVPAEWRDALEQSDRDYRRAMLIDPLCDLRITGSVVPTSPVVIGNDRSIWEVFGDYVAGLRMMARGDYDDAWNRFQRVVNAINGERHADRIWPSLHWWRGHAAARSERLDDAIYDFERLLFESLQEENRDSLLQIPLRTNEFRYVLAVLHQRAGRPNDAIRLYQEVLGEDVGLFMANVQMARIYESVNRWPDAIREREAAIAANPDDASLLYDLGLSFARAGRWADAERSLGQAQDLNPRDARVPYYRGIVATQRGDPTTARAHLTRFLELAPSRYESQINDARRRLEQLP